MLTLTGSGSIGMNLLRAPIKPTYKLMKEALFALVAAISPAIASFLIDCKQASIDLSLTISTGQILR